MLSAMPIAFHVLTTFALSFFICSFNHKEIVSKCKELKENCLFQVVDSNALTRATGEALSELTACKCPVDYNPPQFLEIKLKPKLKSKKRSRQDKEANSSGKKKQR